jgi:hypothetical protein
MSRTEAKTKKRKKGNTLEDQVRRLLPGLEDENSAVRRDTWGALAFIFQTTRGTISSILSRKLVKIQFAERVPLVWDTASRTLPLALLCTRRGVRATRGRRRASNLGEWLWSGFHNPSRVMRVADPGRFRRDEDAVITIARSLSLAEFPKTKFVCIDSDGFSPALDEVKDVKSICFVGRLSLYGHRALSGWDDERQPRYRFGRDFRPKGLPRGELHPEYHSVVRTGNGPDGGQRYVTSESDGERTDYGLIRRYVSTWSGQCRVIVHIAGCSSLGTQAAAHFAAYMLFRPGANRRPIPVPPGTKARSHLEALVRVTAPIKGSEFGWKMGPCEVLDLCVDDWAWSEPQYRWQPSLREAITVRFSDAAARQKYRQPDVKAEILFRRKKVRFRPPSENYSLCLALLMLCAEQGGEVSLEQLGGETWIWKDGKKKTAAEVRRRLKHAHIQKQLGQAFAIEGDTCRLLAEIRIEPDGAAPKKGAPKKGRAKGRTKARAKPRQTPPQKPR